jgi:hypothetical protein
VLELFGSDKARLAEHYRLGAVAHEWKYWHRGYREVKLRLWRDSSVAVAVLFVAECWSNLEEAGEQV